MSAGSYNFILEQGTDFTPFLICKDENGDVVNLTGYTARMQMREAIDSSAKSLDLTTENGGLSITGASGRIDVSVSDTVTVALSTGTYVYDIELIDGSGKIQRILEGLVDVRGEVTR